MTDENEDLFDALSALLARSHPEKRVILLDLLWKTSREDNHGVSDAANDLRVLAVAALPPMTRAEPQSLHITGLEEAN